MWGLENLTPFAAQRAWVRDKDGAEVWLLAIKATFSFDASGQLRLAPQQQPVNQTALYHPHLPDLLLYDTDLPLQKLATDVIVNATAYAPVPSRQWAVQVKLGSIDKTLLISGPRTWQRGLTGAKLTTPDVISHLSLDWTLAFGGGVNDPQQRYTPNPVGRGYTTAFCEALPAAQIEYLHNPVRHWQEASTPAGLGAVAGHWQPRLALAGTYDTKWQTARAPLLPEDFSAGYYQCAPPDQQVKGFLKGGEWAELKNLTPNGYLRLQLPKASFHILTRFSNGRRVRQQAVLHTVIIEPEHNRLMMVWHSHLSCHHQVNQLLGSRIILKKRPLESAHSPGNAWQDGVYA